MRVLVLNAGSSSLKASLLAADAAGVAADDAPGATTALDWEVGAAHAAERAATVRHALETLTRADQGGPIDAVGHRVVHGGSRFREAILLDEAVIRGIEEVAGLAPLHNGVALDTIRTARAELPDVPHVAAFDTAFHATLSPEAFVYPLPYDWYTGRGLRRYGFHGLSVDWSVGRAAGLLGRPIDDLRLVIAHLGNGCSVTAVRAGRSVETSMGYTPSEGLMMGTRSGSVDPGLLLRVLDEGRLDTAGLADVLDHRSGLLGVSGLAGRMEQVERAAAGGHARALLAVSMFARRTAAGIAAAATTLDRIDAIVFTGGIGEHASTVRRAILDRLAVLRLSADHDPDPSGPDRVDRASDRVGPDGRVLIIRAREDRVIARLAAGVVQAYRSK